MAMGATFLFEFGVYLLNSFILSYEIQILAFMKIVFVEIIYNSILTIIFFPLFKKAGTFIEGNFKESKILTRYF